MHSALTIILLILLPCIHANAEYYSSRSSYEVFLHTKDELNKLGENFCWGTILQSHIILTAASCFFTDGKRTINAENMAVTFSDLYTKDIIYAVNSINIYHKFNMTTMEHDVALLRLSNSLPLSQRDDLKWIVLADTLADVEQCLIYQKELSIMNSGPLVNLYECNFDGHTNCTDIGLLEKTEHTTGKYMVELLGCDLGSWKYFAEYDQDKGRAIVCKNHVVAILSAAEETSITNESKELCLTSRNELHFIPILPYLSWIFNAVTNEEIRDMQYNNYTSSLPYQEPKSAPIVDALAESENLISAVNFNTKLSGNYVNGFIYVICLRFLSELLH